MDSETSEVSMAVNKNFVVKNGVEVSQDLLFADNNINAVGIGTTTPNAKLQVIGNISGEAATLTGALSATDGSFSGAVSSNTGLNVGASGTSITVNVTDNSTGFNSTTPDTRYTLNVNPGAGQSAANFGGGVVIDGDLELTGSFSGQVNNITNLNITGVLTASDSDIYTQFNVQNNGSAAYQYLATGIGFTQNTDNPLLYLIRGKQYRFSLNAAGHPFYIKNAAGAGTTNQYNAGIEGQGTQVGILTFTVPFNAPSSVYYQCSNHAGMGNTIYLLDGTGSGGGAVQSVNGQTGIVSIGVTQLDDFALKTSTVYQWDTFDTGGALSAGEYDIRSSGTRLLVNSVDSNGQDVTSLWDVGTTSRTWYISQAGGAYVPTTIGQRIDNTFNLEALSLSPALTDSALTTPLRLTFQDLPEIPLANGDIIVYNSSTGEFNPEQPSSGGAGGGGIGSGINYPNGEVSPFAYVDATSTASFDIEFNNTNAGPGSSFVVVASPQLVVSTGVAVTVGTGKTLVIDILNLGEIQ